MANLTVGNTLNDIEYNGNFASGQAQWDKWELVDANKETDGTGFEEVYDENAHKANIATELTKEGGLLAGEDKAMVESLIVLARSNLGNSATVHDVMKEVYKLLELNDGVDFKDEGIGSIISDVFTFTTNAISNTFDGDDNSQIGAASNVIQDITFAVDAKDVSLINTSSLLENILDFIPGLSDVNNIVLPNITDIENIIKSDDASDNKVYKILALIFKSIEASVKDNENVDEKTKKSISAFETLFTELGNDASLQDASKTVAREFAGSIAGDIFQGMLGNVSGAFGALFPK